MDQWRVTVLGDGGVGKTALAVQVSWPPHSECYCTNHSDLFYHFQFTLNCFIGQYPPAFQNGVTATHFSFHLLALPCCFHSNRGRYRLLMRVIQLARLLTVSHPLPLF